MIKSFACKETKRVWDGIQSTRFPRDMQERALIKLRLIDAAISLSDLKAPPGNKLEILRGDRRGQMSVRINLQWRICFRWDHGEVYDVEIVDYH